MNCANHADASAVAYCRTCGKALCANCTRPVKGVIYCEDCLGAKMAGTTPVTPPPPYVPGVTPPAAGFVPATPVISGSGPNPALAGVLAGFFPFGVGAVYTGQYAKGLGHMVIMGLLLAGLTNGGNHGAPLIVALALATGFFYCYQIIDAVRSARALQAGQAPPDPFNLTQTFSSGEKIDPKKIPAGAVVLIVIGGVFLLHTLGLSEFGIDRFWPILLIALGGWMFARNFGLLDQNSAPVDPRTRTGRLTGPAVITTVGVLFLLSEFEIANFGRTWPIILLVIGGVKLLGSTASSPGPMSSGPMSPGGPVPPPPGDPATPVSGEVNRG